MFLAIRSKVLNYIILLATSYKLLIKIREKQIQPGRRVIMIHLSIFRKIC